MEHVTLYGILMDGPAFCEHKVVGLTDKTKAIKVQCGKQELFYRCAERRFHQEANAYEFWLNSDENRNRLRFKLRTGDDVPFDLNLTESSLTQCDFWNPTLKMVVRSRRYHPVTPMFVKKSHIPEMGDATVPPEKSEPTAMYRKNFRS